jgi:hypothetical protein
MPKSLISSIGKDFNPVDRLDLDAAALNLPLCVSPISCIDTKFALDTIGFAAAVC